MLPFDSEFSEPHAKIRRGCGSNNEAGHISKNKDRFRVQHHFWKLSWQVVPKIGFTNAVYVGLLVLVPLQEISVAVAAGRVSLDTDSMPGWLSILFL